MGKISKNEEEYRDTAFSFCSQASNTVLDAFNEGYLLGIKHAKRVLGEDDEN